nr:unnamed protein product [Callosobruchus analis]
MNRWWWINMCHSGKIKTHQQQNNIHSNSGSLNGAHSSEFGFPVVPPGGVREAANTLATALQAVATPPPPEPHVVKVLTRWLQQVSR